MDWPIYDGRRKALMPGADLLIACGSVSERVWPIFLGRTALKPALLALRLRGM